MGHTVRLLGKPCDIYYLGHYVTFVVRVAVLTMKPVVPDPDISPRLSIAELNAGNSLNVRRIH